ncbi:MAG: cupin domain-containing protein [Nocardioidaceae bacterium]|nr:cupin domain-containing protein [Nocardioidaceae bacterium]
MQIHRHDDDASTTAPEATFTGDVRIDGYVRRDAPSRLTCATVVFPPGARTSWKTNPAGQTLVVTSGTGWAQSEGEDVVEVRAGDVVWCEPGRQHWEGATPGSTMTYVALHEGTVQFLDRVTDEQYRRSRGTAPRGVGPDLAS